MTKTYKLQNVTFKGWWPENPEFRDYFNADFNNQIQHSLDKGDFTPLSKLVNSIPDEKSKTEIIRKTVLTFPCRWIKEKETFRKDKKYFDGFDYNKIKEFKALSADNFFTAEDGIINIEKTSMSEREFVDFMLDTIILNRKAFTVDDLEKVEETLEIIKKRLKRKKEN